MILIPELTIYNELIKLFNFINLDFAARANESDTILYHIFHNDINNQNLTFNKTNYYEQAKALFILRNNDSPRKLEVGLGFNFSRASFPTIHILMPSETPQDSPIGTNEGYFGNLDSEDSDKVYKVFTMNFQTQFALLITSDNSLETLLIYVLMKTGFIGIKTQLELQGFQNVNFGGTDLALEMNFLPEGIFSRNFTLNFSYDFSGRDIFATQLPNSITTTGQLS